MKTSVGREWSLGSALCVNGCCRQQGALKLFWSGPVCGGDTFVSDVTYCQTMMK